MYNIPIKYKKESIINKENFIPKSETIQNKKKIREELKRVRLKYQIEKNIPNLIDENHNIQVIMVLEIELKSMKHVEYINQVFQELLKSYVIVKYICDEKVALGYGYKRLNKKDSSEIILEDSFVTEEYEEVFFFNKYSLYENYLDFESFKNNNNKLEFYMENMTKAYIISNIDNFKDYETILKSNIYYSLDSNFKLYKLAKSIVDTNAKLKNKNTTVEKIELNKKLDSLIKELEGLLDGRN